MKIKVIYNPNAGSKRSILKTATFEDIKSLLEQYQIPVTYVATKGPGDATKFAKESVKQKYTHVLAAGGDGTVSEVANGLIGSDVILGILPMGTFMNICKMLAVPNDLEKAIMLIKIGKTRKIDVAQIKKINGETQANPIYFLENSGVGMEAELQKSFKLWEDGDWKQIPIMVRAIFDFYSQKFEIAVDKKVLKVKASLIEVSNGPWTGAKLNIAPDAKLNDHRLTVSIFHMQKWELLIFLWKIFTKKPARSPKIERYQAQEVSIKSAHPRTVHADASEFGTTPISYSILPNALNVIAGFTNPLEKTALRPRTSLDA